jgi:hypothetical protein
MADKDNKSKLTYHVWDKDNNEYDIPDEVVQQRGMDNFAKDFEGGYITMFDDKKQKVDVPIEDVGEYRKQGYMWYDTSGNATPINEVGKKPSPSKEKEQSQYPQEMKRGELKKPSLISQALGMMPKMDAGNIGREQKVGGMIANLLLGDNMQVQQPAQKEASPESKEAAPVTTPTGVVNNEGLMDAKLANYIENWKQRPDKQGTYFENMVADLLADGTANSNEEAVNMVMPALRRYANRSAMDVTNQVVSSLPDDTVQDAEQNIDAQWYSHGVQDKLKQEADSMGISYDDYVAHFLKPAMVQSLVNKYGPNYRNIAEGIATRLYSHDENVQDRLMNQDINDALSSVISKYVSPSVVDEYNKAQEAGSKAFMEGMEGSQFIPANLRLGTALGAQYEANETKDPAKVLSGLQQKFGKLYRNPKFLNDMSNAAFKVMQRYGLNGTQSSDPKQFKPMINAVLKNELDQLEIKGMMPKGSAEYIMKTGLGNTIVGKITRKAVQTDYQNWLEDIANQQYQPGFWENVASGALTFAGDAWSYWLPGAAGGKLTKSMVAKAEGKLAGDLMAKGMERRVAERAAKVLIGKSKDEALKSGAVHGAVTFGGQSAISKPIDEVYRTGQFDENGKIYNPSVCKVIADTLGEVAKQTAVGAIMQGGTIANMVGKGRGLATNILADVGGKVVDSGIMTGHQMLERMAQDPNFKPTGKDAAESFLESMANLTAIGLPGMVGKYARFKDAMEFNKKFDFTDQDIAELKRFGYDGLRDAFEKMGIGEYAVVGENAQRLDGQLTQKYMNLMNDKSVPEVLKAKMMAVVEGKRPSSFSPVVDSVIVQPMDHDGKVYLETLNKDGGIIDRKEFSSLDEAQKADKKLEYEKTLGLASVLEGEFHNEFTQEHLEGLYNKAAQKYNMGEKLTDEDKAAVYLHQNAGAIKEIMDKQQKGIILTDEEQKQINAYRHYYDSALENSSVMREFVNTFEDSHGVARGTLRKALESKDKKYAPLVESYLKELYNSIELKREMKQTMDDLYNTAHGNEQKRIEQGGVEGEKPTAPVEGSAGGQEPPVSEAPSPYQGNTDVSSGQGEGVSTAISDNSSADVITSDAFVMGQNAYKNGDSEALQAIDYNSDLATGRLQRAFADNEKMPDIVAKAYNEGRDMEQFVAQRASSLTPAQKEAISKYVEAMDAKKGAIDALQHADDGYGEALKQQLWPYQTVDGNIVPATLDSGKQVFLKKANEYGGAFVVVPDEHGQLTIKQVSNAEIKEVGAPVSLDKYIENAVAQQKDARAQQFISQFDGSGLKPNDRVTVAMEEGDANIDMTFAGYSEEGKIVLTDGKDYLPLSKEEFAAWRKNALDNTINEHLDAEDDEREQKAVSQAEADKKQRYANDIVGLSEGQPDYSSKNTDPNVAAEYLQEQFGEDHGKLLNLVNGSRDDIETQLANKKKAAAEYQNWLDTNADLDPEKAKKVEDELSLVNEQIADLDARFKNWNTIRNSVMTPDELRTMKEERKAEIERAGIDKSSVLPDVDTGVRIPENSELKDKYPTQEAASGYITSERRRVYKMQEETQREIDGVDKILNQYMDGDMELSAEQLRDLNTTKAELANRQNALTADAKALKGKAESLNILYIKERAEQNKKNLEALSPKDRRKELVAKALEDIRNLVLRDLANGVDPRTKMQEGEAKEFHSIIDQMFDDPTFDKSQHNRERYDLGKTPEWMQGIGIKGEDFSLSFKSIKVHKGKDADHDLTKEEWHELPNALIHPFAITRYQGAEDRFRLYVNINHDGKPVAVGVDVKRVNQGKNKPQLEVNSIKTIFAHHGEIGGSEVLVTYDKKITPKQQELLRGLNFHEYPTIQELSAAKIRNNIETAKGNGGKLSVEEKIKAVSQQFGVDEADVAMYANAVKKGSTAEAARARANIKRHLLQVNEDKISSLKELLKYTVPVNNALKENFGDLDAMIEERVKQVEAQRNAMEAARKRAEEEEAKRQKHLEELSVIPDDQLDKQYMDAIAKGDDATAREMLDEAARRKGYDDTESAYQGVGAWAAPGNPGYESDKARRDDWESSGSDVNLEDMALGYTPQPDDYFSHPERYSQNTPHGLESVKAINTAIDAIKNGEKDVKVKVYRAVPTSVKEGKLRNGDWVTPSKKYAEMHGTNRLEGKYRIIEDEVPATQLWWDGNDANEFGFDDGKAYKYKNAKNNRKLNDLVTYDNKGDVIPPSKRFNSRKSDVRFMFAGEKGAAEADKADEQTIRMDNLDVAKQMEKAKKDAKIIKMATGWEKGVDGKWRYEMPDAKIKDTIDVGGGNIVKRFEEDMLWTDGKLEDAVDAPKLFEAYPQLKNIKIHTDAVMNDMPSNGEYNPQTKTITIHADELKYLNSILNHEIQHVIQHEEGFAHGGTPEQVERDFNAAKAEWKARSYAFELEEKAKEMGGEYNQSAVEKALIQEYKDMDMPEFIPDKETRIKGFNYFARGYADRSMDDAIKRFRLDRFQRTDFDSYQEYRKLAGEVESRNVEKRLGMTDEERRNSLASETEDVNRDEQIVMNGNDASYSIVKDPETIKKLDKEDTVKVYRAMQVGEDGKLYPPMAAKVKGKFVEPIELGKWEQADERPELADDKGMFTLNKGNGKSLKAAYNPYLHTSRTPLNDQFSEAQNRPNIVTVEVEVPKSELTSGYKADKAKDAVGEVEWKAGIIQGQLTGKRKVVLSRWDKPVRIVPDSEVADVIVNDMFKGKNITMPSNVVTPSLRKELEKRGVPFVETDNRGRIVGGENDGVHYSKVYGKKANVKPRLGSATIGLKAAKDKVVELFHKAKSGEFNGKPQSIGTLTQEGKKFLEDLSGLKMKDKIDFVLNPSDLKHMNKDHFGDNEKDPGRNIPLTEEDLRSMVDVIMNPEQVVYGIEKMDNRKAFFFLKQAEDGTLNLAEIYSDKKGNLTAKSYYKTKKGVDQRVMEIKNSLLPTPEASSGSPLSDGKGINFFSIEQEKTAENERKIADSVVNTANKLGGAEATVYSSLDDVPEEYRSEVEQGAKGWYDPETHSVHVYLPNCEDGNDAQRTVFHEKIGHEGMEVLLGGEDSVRKFANFVYRSVGKDVRGKIIDFANKYDPDWKNPDRMNVGTQEYIAHLAEEGPKTAEDFSLWTKIKHYLIKVLKKLGVRVPGLLNDKDLRYYLMKAGKALHVWDNMPKEKQEAMMKQASNAEIKDALSDGAGKGKPRQKKGESTIQYMKRVQEWRKWQNAREDKENPEPPMFYDFDKDAEGKKEWERLNKEWRDSHHLQGDEMPIKPERKEGETDEEFFPRYKEWEKWNDAMADKENPMPDMFAFEKKKQEEVKRKYEDWLAKHDLLEQQQADLDLYEGKIYPAETNPKADALEQQVMQDLAEVTSTDVSKEGAAKTVKHAVIHRRKNMEEASADDAIYINDVKNRIEKMADSGAFDKLLSDYKGKPNKAEKLAEAIPYIIEAPRRLRDLAHDLNATDAFDKGHIHIQPDDVEAIQPFVADLIAETAKMHTVLKDDKEVKVYDDPQAVSEVANKLAQAINANHQGEEGFVPIDGTDILSKQVLPLVKQQIVPVGIDYKNLSPEMKATIDSIRDWYNYTYDWLKDNHTLREDTGYNADYVNHIWDKEKSDKQAYAMYVENRQRTKSPNEKPRTISTLMEGISVGLVPKTTDITKMMAYYSRSNIEAWVNKTMLQELSGLNVIERNEDGEIVSSDPLLSSTPPFNLEQYQYFEIPGVGPVWVYNVSPKQVKVKNPITGKEKVLYSEASAGDRFGVVFETYQSSPFWKAFDTAASSAKKMELGFSGFHAGALTEVYMVQNMVEFGPKKAMANFMKYIFADTAKNHELPCFANPEDFQEAATHGVKFGATNDYAAADVQNMFDNFRDTLYKIQEKLENGNVISKAGATVSLPFKIASQLLSLINKGMDRALWDFLHDGLKLATYRMRADKTKERAKKKGWTEEELSRALDEDGQFVNDMFGGQHWDVLGASHRTLRYAGRVLLSPDWNTSTTRHFLALTGYGSVWNEATFENFKEYYKHLWAAARGKGELTPEDWGRFSRQKSAFLCYGLGFMVFYEGIANGINAAFRALDEEKERKKAEEIRKTNPNYRSMYELAYGDKGMKWYDYLMRGNSLGQQSKIFLGRYEDGTEMYVRHGKQFREVPEYLFNHKGELEFPGPMVQRMIGKANPMVRMTLDDINYLSDFQASHADQEIQRKYGKTIGLLYKDALYWAPFLIPSQENKEFKAVDFFFPSSKGFSPWKAQSYFKDFILSGDMEGVVMTYQSCQRNGIDAEAQIKAAIGSVKALESAEMQDGVTSLQEASKRFDAAKSITEKKKMRQKIKKFLSQSNYKAFTQKEALDMVQGYLNGDEDLKEMEKAESKYLMKAKAEDVTEDWRIQNVWSGTMETYQEYQRLKDVDKAKANTFKNSKTNKRLFAARKAIYAARRKMNKAKKQMDGTNDAAKLVEIRNTRKELLKTLNGME